MSLTDSPDFAAKARFYSARKGVTLGEAQRLLSRVFSGTATPADAADYADTMQSYKDTPDTVEGANLDRFNEYNQRERDNIAAEMARMTGKSVAECLAIVVVCAPNLQGMAKASRVPTGEEQQMFRDARWNLRVREVKAATDEARGWADADNRRRSNLDPYPAVAAPVKK